MSVPGHVSDDCPTQGARSPGGCPGGTTAADVFFIPVRLSRIDVTIAQVNGIFDARTALLARQLVRSESQGRNSITANRMEDHIVNAS